jgi:hypothetical protein
MARNRYFNQYTPVKKEQSLVEDLIVESIKIYGVDGYYIPRTHVNLNKFYGEDASMYFDDALPMEMYIKSYDGFQGQEDFLSKFGLQIDESITFVVAQKRFTESLKPLFLTEYGYSLKMEDGDKLLNEDLTLGTDGRPKTNYNYEGILRPREGDLIWVPMLSYMYEIKFTENIENFFQLGKLYTYEMRCDRYEYSSERIDTDVADIDGIEDQFSLSTDNVEKLLVEDNDLFALEDGTNLVNEGTVIVNVDVAADNEYLGEKMIDDDVVDFSEKNPFADVRVY